MIQTPLPYNRSGPAESSRRLLPHQCPFAAQKAGFSLAMVLDRLALPLAPGCAAAPRLCQQQEKGETLRVTLAPPLLSARGCHSIPLEVTAGCGIAVCAGYRSLRKSGFAWRGVLRLDTKYWLCWLHIQTPWGSSLGKDGVGVNGCQQELVPLALFTTWSSGRGGI